MVEDMWVEGRAQMETYQLMRAGKIEARTSRVVAVDWSTFEVCGHHCCAVNTFSDKLNKWELAVLVGAHLFWLPRHQLLKCAEKLIIQG